MVPMTILPGRQINCTFSDYFVFIKTSGKKYFSMLLIAAAISDSCKSRLNGFSTYRKAK